MKQVLNMEYDFLQEFVDSLPDGTFDNSGETLHNGRNCVKLFNVDGKKVVVKRFKKPNTFNRFMYTFFRGTKAKRAYNHAFRLIENGIQTPRAIAFIDIKSKGLIKTSYVVTEFTDFKPVSNFFNEEKFARALLADAFIKFTANLHEKGINHLDYNSHNVLYKIDDDYSCQFELIDINRMKFGKMSKRECLSSIKRLCINSQVTFYISQKYAEARGWNQNGCLAELAMLRSVFEKRKQTVLYIKELVKG